MIDRSKTLAKRYIKQWYDDGVIKSSMAANLIEKHKIFSTLDSFVLFAVKRYNIGYENFPSDYQNDLTFAVNALKQSKDSIALLVDIANANKSMYVRILENLEEEELLALLKEETKSETSKTKLVAKLRKVVNNRILESKTKNL